MNHWFGLKWGLGLAAFTVFAGNLFAQIGMQVELNRTVFMQYEPIYACVTLRNDSGKALVFGDDPRLQGFILFDIRDAKGQQVPKRPNKEISVKALVLRPGETKPMVLPISQYYNLDPTGTYRVRAYVSHAMLPSEFQSPEALFRVDTGVTIWKRTVGIPDLSDNPKPDAPLQERTYSIRSLVEGPAKYYYLFVEDATHVYGVMRVGKALGQEPIKADIDMLSRIHLLIPITPKVFQYLSFGLDGSNTVNQYWKTSSTIPTMVRDPESGRIFVTGGAVARPGIDFKDPNAGKLTTAKLLDEYEEAYKEEQPDKMEQTAPAAGGIVDLGAEL